MKLNKREKELWNMRIDLGNSVTPSNIITQESQNKKREKGVEYLFQKIIAEYFTYLGEAQRTSNQNQQMQANTKTYTDKEQILKAAR